MSGAICIFAKVPRPGRVKTRLARALGDARAVALAEAFLEDTVTLAQSIESTTTILALDDAPPPRWREEQIAIAQQGEGDLGERLARVLGDALTRHPWAIALGTDSPGVPPRFVREALAVVAGTTWPSAVFGPADDGGFYLLGLNAMPPNAFTGVGWSTASARSDCERALARAGVVSSHVEGWFDVDEVGDLERLRGLLVRGAIEAPATARVLAGGERA